MKASRLIIKRTLEVRSNYPGANVQLCDDKGDDITEDEGAELLEGGRSLQVRAFTMSGEFKGSRTIYASEVTK